LARQKVQDVFALGLFVIVDRDPLRPTAAAFAVGDAHSGRRRRMVAAAA
jgi:hypothetical protein